MVKRLIAKLLVLNFICLSAFTPLTQAAMIGTPSVLQQQQTQDSRARLQEIINRADLQDRLQQAGVNPADIQARVDALSDQEVAALVDQFEQLPAGGDALGLAVFVFLVLLVTDILGYTDIFPFVKK